MNIAINEMMETLTMVQMENLDIRTVTMGINLTLTVQNSDFWRTNESPSVYRIKSLHMQKI